MKILIEWMAVYTPAMLKFFDCAVSSSAIEGTPEIESNYVYR